MFQLEWNHQPDYFENFQYFNFGKNPPGIFPGDLVSRAPPQSLEVFKQCKGGRLAEWWDAMGILC